MTATIPDLSSFITDAVQRKTSTESIRALVDKQIDQIINSAVTDALRTYAPIGKQIEKEVQACLALPPNLNIPAFGNTLLNMLRQKVDANLSDLVNTRLSEQMDEILGLAPKEMKLTELIEAMHESVSGLDRYGSSLTCIIEESSHVPGYHHIYLDTENKASRDKYQCSCILGIDSDGKIYSALIDKKDAAKTIIMGPFHGWEKRIFAAYCCGSKFIIDDFHPNLSIGDD